MSELQSGSKYLMIILNIVIYIVKNNNGITFENIISNVKNQWEVIFFIYQDFLHVLYVQYGEHTPQCH